MNVAPMHSCTDGITSDLWMIPTKNGQGGIKPAKERRGEGANRPEVHCLTISFPSLRCIISIFFLKGTIGLPIDFLSLWIRMRGSFEGITRG